MEKIAQKGPEKIQVESKVKRFSRLLQHETVSHDLFFLPFVMPLGYNRPDHSGDRWK